MAQKTIVTLIDDINGESIGEGEGRTVAFAFDGTNYEIDLLDAHVDELSAALQPYIAQARRVTRAGTKSTSRPSAAKRDLARVREWLRAPGHTVSERGRIPAALLEEYDAGAGK
ncbi:histone-like nucleoid-structuring protein Lsr2 [Mycetocola reblochoni]|uniref:Histone protein Lsr2 n=1 Tax=Mycetocola reblochoni REB411 TaxID=1255698 RepID=A0A1R4K365_9MICO|nr:Lsr2 family protein [Mycetocola reblochoni]SJN38632.1 Histone protein Lsr2 [Mycetocola reblochoni REB411]